MDIEMFKLRSSAIYKPASVERKIVALTQFEKFLRERGMTEGLESLNAWVNELIKQGKSANTISAYVRDVLSYFNIMMLYIDERKLAMFKRTLPPVRLGKAECLTEEEVANLIHVARYPYKLIYALCYTYARRLGEVLSAKVNLRENTITFPILKRKVEETATYELEQFLREMIEEYFNEFGKKERLFDVTKRAVEIAFKCDCERAGIDANGRKLRVHMLRHSRITHALSRGAKIEVVSKYLAQHASIATTVSYYMAVTEEMKESIPKAEEVLRL